MTMQARTLCHTLVTGFDLNGVFKVTRGERQRVKESVVCFDNPLPEGIVRQVAVIAGGDRVMAGGQPRIVMFLHHVTVGTRSWIVL